MLFIDGSNWYHGLGAIGVDSGGLDYPRMARKLAMDRAVVGIRYYVGEVSGELRRMRGQQEFLKRLKAQGVGTFLGRVERRLLNVASNPLVLRLRSTIAECQQRVPEEVLAQLEALARENVPYFVEKQVDVRIAVDMVRKAHTDEYDIAYLLSADGDFVPAVREVQRVGKKVFAATALRGNQLAGAVNAFIPLAPEWFDGLSAKGLDQPTSARTRVRV